MLRPFDRYILVPNGEVMAFFDEQVDHSNFSVAFSRNPRAQFSMYARGYVHSAQVIAGTLIARRSFPDYDAYPVMFLYRQALELYLKGIIYDAALLAAFERMSDGDSKLHNCHNLQFLFDKAARLLERLFPNDPSLHEAMSRLSVVINEFAYIDPVSIAFRYPISRDGDYSAPKGLNCNVASIRDHLGPHLETLDTIEFGLDMETSIAQELYEEFENL